MSARCTITGAPAVTISPPFGERANSAMPRSIAPGSCTLIGVELNSKGWRHGLDRAPLACAGGVGAIPKDRHSRHPRRDLFEKFQPFPADTVFGKGKPGHVAAWPRQARNEASAHRVRDQTNTIGMVWVACCSSDPAYTPVARITSGADDPESEAYLRASAALLGQRMSICALRPSVQPNRCSPPRNAAMRACPSGSSAPVDMSTPMRRRRSPCCARTASGHAAAAPPSKPMNSRRLKSRPPFLEDRNGSNS